MARVPKFTRRLWLTTSIHSLKEKLGPVHSDGAGEPPKVGLQNGAPSRTRGFTVAEHSSGIKMVDITIVFMGVISWCL